MVEKWILNPWPIHGDLERALRRRLEADRWRVRLSMVLVDVYDWLL